MLRNIECDPIEFKNNGNFKVEGEFLFLFFILAIYLKTFSGVNININDEKIVLNFSSENEATDFSKVYY